MLGRWAGGLLLVYVGLLAWTIVGTNVAMVVPAPVIAAVVLAMLTEP